MAKIKIINKFTGIMTEVDTEEQKHLRKRRRITAWMKYYSDEVNLGKQRSRPYEAVFITLTYENNDLFEVGQIRSYIKLIKERLGEKLISYAWVCESQKRHVPHYHILLIVKRGTRIRKPDEKDWKYGMSNVQKCYKGLYYIISYLKKLYDTVLPKHARCFGIFARGIIKRSIRVDTLPNWVIDICASYILNMNGKIKKITGGWEIGEVKLNTPYMVRKNLVTGSVLVY